MDSAVHRALLDALEGTVWLMAALMYGAGLRPFEGLTREAGHV